MSWGAYINSGIGGYAWNAEFGWRDRPPLKWWVSKPNVSYIRLGIVYLMYFILTFRTRSDQKMLAFHSRENLNSLLW